MATTMNTVSFGDYGVEQADIERRRKYAEALQAQSMQPLETQTAGGWAIPISPMQGLAKALQAYSSKQRLDKLKGEQQALGQRARDDFGTWAGQMPQAQTRDLNLVHGDDEGNAVPPALQTTAPSQQEMMAWALKGGASGNPYAAQMAGPVLAQALKANDPYTLTPGAVRMQGGAQVAAAPFRPDTAKEHVIEGKVYVSTPSGLVEKGGPGITPKPVDRWSEPYTLNGVTVQKNETTGQIRTAVTRPPQVRVEAPAPAPILQTDAAGNTKMYDRAGNLIKDLGKTGKPSATFEKTQNARKQLERDLTSTISELEDITKDGGLIDQSTGSGAGSLVDSAAGFFGKATPGAVAVGKLKPIYDKALKMVPRFEGPQSDKDTKSYADAAGQIANPNIPNPQKKAAAQEILRLMKERKNQFVTADMAGTETDGDWSDL